MLCGAPYAGSRIRACVLPSLLAHIYCCSSLGYIVRPWHATTPTVPQPASTGGMIESGNYRTPHNGPWTPPSRVRRGGRAWSPSYLSTRVMLSPPCHRPRHAHGRDTPCLSTLPAALKSPCRNLGAERRAHGVLLQMCSVKTRESPTELRGMRSALEPPLSEYLQRHVPLSDKAPNSKL